MNHVLSKLGDRRPSPRRWSWLLALVLMLGISGATWYIASHGSYSTVFAQTPESPTQPGPSDAVQRALPLITSAPPLPGVGQHPAPVPRDPFDSAPGARPLPAIQPAPAANDPFGSVTVRKEAGHAEPAPWGRTTQPAVREAEQRSPEPFTRSTREAFGPTLQPSAPAADVTHRSQFPFPAPPMQDTAVRPVQELQPPATQDVLMAPSVEATDALTPPATPAASQPTELFASPADPEPPISAPAQESNPFQLAAPIEERMTAPAAPEASTNPFASPTIPSADQPLPPISEPAPEPATSVFSSSPPVRQPALEPAPSIFSNSPPVSQPEPEPVPTPYQPSPSPFPPTSSQFPQPLENTSRPLLTSPPATRVSSTEPALAEEQIYKVQPGDNYWTISKAFYGSGRYFGGLAQYNSHRIPSPEKMKPGMIVLIPDALVLHRKYPQLCGPDPSQIKPEEPFGFFVDAQGHPAFRVGEGDTLGGIAQKHLGRVTRAEQLYQMNKDRIRDPNNLKLGTILRLPPDAAQVMQLP